VSRKESELNEHTVLIIEDDQEARVRLAKSIRREGFNVLTADDGKVGIDIAAKERPEIIVTDFNLPGANGLEVIKRVKALDADVEVILITAFGEFKTVVSAFNEGILDYIKKPIDLDLSFAALTRPQQKIAEIKPDSPSSSISTSPADDFVPTVLVVDDDEMMRNWVVQLLESNGCKIFTAEDGVVALEVFNRQKIDIVLLDIQMPRKNGLDTLHNMKELRSDFQAIMLTGESDEAHAIRALRLGAWRFLTKPLQHYYTSHYSMKTWAT